MNLAAGAWSMACGLDSRLWIKTVIPICSYEDRDVFFFKIHPPKISKLCFFDFDPPLIYGFSVYIYMYTCIHVYAYTYINICICIYMCIYDYLCIYVYMYIRIYAYMYICIYVHMYICTYVYMYICIYVYM